VVSEDTAGAGRLVGRQRELATLRSLIVSAAGGDGCVAMLFGEPGIGKSRLVSEVATLARAEGATVCFGTCYERLGRPPYVPWVEVLTQYARSLEPASFLESAKGSAAIVAAVVPELDWAVVAEPEPLSSEEGRMRFFDAVARLLTSSQRPLVVVLDDLQWADPPALDLLEYVTRSLDGARLLVLGAHRDVVLGPHPLNDCLAELNRQGRYEPIHLRPLMLDETAALAGQLAAGPVSRSAAAAIHADTAGNPFFIGEVVREVEDEGFDLASEAPTPELWGISPTIRQTVSRRLARLSSDANRVINIAAAFAGPFAFEVLMAAIELDEETLLDGLDELLAAGMIRPAADADAFEFSHSLVRETLYGALSPSRRARVHRRVAQALERTYAGRESEAAAELASQYNHSRSLPGAEQGLPLALLAAEHAAARHAHAEAVTYLRMARNLASSSAPPQRAETLCRLALAQVDALMVDESLETVEEALRALAEAAVEPSAVANFLRVAAWSLHDAGAPQEAVASLIERGLASASGRRDVTWARLKLAERPVKMLSAGPLRAGRWLGFDREAVRIARESGKETDYARTIELMDWRSRAETETLYALVKTWNDPTAAIHGLSVVVRDLVTKHGAFIEAEEVCIRLFELGERVGSVQARAFGLLYLTHVYAARGDLSSARESLTRSGEVIDRLGSGHRLQALRGFIEFMLAQYTDVDLERLARIETERAFDPRTPAWITLLHASAAAYAHARSGNAAEARRYLGWIVPTLAELEPRTINQGGATFFATAAAWELGEAEHAGQLRRLALDLVASEVADYTPVSSELTVARAAALLGEVDDARAWFDRARGALDQRGTRPLRAMVDYDEALVLRLQDPAAAARLLDHARSEFGELEMTGWLERAERLLWSLRGAHPAGLTARETEVLRLLASGRTNKEIAADLVISVHTVERHVATIYRKIGARNRSDATALAHKSGLANT
jgi:DNA-binding CsgD family transcriptional regulator